MSDMAGNAARVAVERSWSCRDTRRLNFSTLSGPDRHPPCALCRTQPLSRHRSSQIAQSWPALSTWERRWSNLDCRLRWQTLCQFFKKRPPVLI